jgi:predicted metal-binding membrane protein
MSAVVSSTAGVSRPCDAGQPPADPRPDVEARRARRTTLTSDVAFLGVSALLFIASVAATIVESASMADMAGMDMPGGWTMSMAWMRMPGQGWLDAAASFIGMWTVMMVAMMMPSLVPILWRYRRNLAAAGVRRPGWLAALAGVAYLCVWSVSGLVVYPLGVLLAQGEMLSTPIARAVPLAVGVVVVLAGALQFTSWKVRQLACCRNSLPHQAGPSTDTVLSFRYGVSLARYCGLCCVGLMAILLAKDVMDLGVMAAVTLAITVERLAPGGRRVARALGIVIVAIGVVLIAQAAAAALT